MKIFSWNRGKLNGKQMTTKSNSASATHHKLCEYGKEEFSDWPNGLLAIGTFGNSAVKDPGKYDLTYQNQPDDIISDGAGEFHKDLNMLMRHNSGSANASEKCNLPPEGFSASMHSLQDDKSTNNEGCDDSANGEGRPRRSSVQACPGGKDLCLDKTNIGIQKKSLSLLLKKAFACAGGFTAPPPALRDPFPESKLETSTMEKIMRTILHKKIYPQGYSPRATGNKYLDNKNMYESDREDDEASDKVAHGSKWVKTDSEYIVLEI